MWRAEESVARRRVWAERVWIREGASTAELVTWLTHRIQLGSKLDKTYSIKGIRTLYPTLPVSVTATFTIPSVPAEIKLSPSTPKTKLRQLPLCRFVRHEVSMAPPPPFFALEVPLCGFALATGGRR